MQKTPEILNNKDGEEKKPFANLKNIVERERNPENWQNWREQLPREVLKTIPEQFQSVLDRIAKERANLEAITPEENQIAMIISAWNAKDVLPETLKENVVQMRESGVWGDIIVGLNYGGGNTREYLYADKDFPYFKGEDARQHREMLNERFQDELGVNEVLFGRTLPLRKHGQERGVTDYEYHQISRPIEYDGEFIPDNKSGIRLVVIDQQEEAEYNRGKIRALRDIYADLYSRTKLEGYCPQLALLEDAETHLRSRDETTGKIDRDTTTGLQHMIELSQNGKVWVGAKNHLLPYTEDGLPNWEARIPPMQSATNNLHGEPGAEWLPGGASLVDYRGAVAINKIIAQEYPGLRVEDALLTTIARTFGVNTTVDKEVVHTNRCPADEKRALMQMRRWQKGNNGLEKIIGPELAKIHTDLSLFKGMMINLKEIANRKRDVDVLQLLKAYLPSHKVLKEAKNDPENPYSTHAGWKPGQE